MPPPPLPPVVIPQNTNPIPTAMTSPGGDSTGMMSPSSGSGSFVRRAAPEPNKRALYVGGLDPRVTEDILRQIFETTGHVQNVKIIPDKNMGAVSKTIAILRLLNTLDFSDIWVVVLCRRAALARFSYPFCLFAWRYAFPPIILLQNLVHNKRLRRLDICSFTDHVKSKGFNYGFIEYDDPGAAERAMQTLNGRRVHQAVSNNWLNLLLCCAACLHHKGNPR